MASQYLHDNEEILKARKYLAESKTRQWYECWVPQTLEKFQKKKKKFTFPIDIDFSVLIDLTFITLALLITFKNTIETKSWKILQKRFFMDVILKFQQLILQDTKIDSIHSWKKK